MSMIIGIDASRAFVKERTGTEEYSYQLITHLLSLPESNIHKFVLFTRPGALIPDSIRNSIKVKIREIKSRYLWTQVGLAVMTWHEPLDVLWIPAHTLPILRKPNLKTVVTIHGMEYKWLPEYKNWLQRWYLPLSTYYAARFATKLIAVSENTKNDLLKELHIDTKKIKVIWEGSDNQITQKISLSANQLARVMEKYGLQSKGYILFIGSLQPRKNLPALIETFGIFAPFQPSFKLVISGSKGWMSEEIFQSVAKYGLEDKVIFTGRVAEEVKQALLSNAKTYVQPSITEGFGLPVVEAMQMGVPVIVSSGGALPEVVGEKGEVIKLGNSFVKELATKLMKVVENNQHCEMLITNGFKRAQELSWVTAARYTLKTLENL